MKDKRSVYVYVLVSAEGFTYVGMTKDLNRRMKEHNCGQSQYTQKGSDWRIVHVEEYSSRPEARKREKYFKSHAGKDWLKRRQVIP